jgi:hypothetical protein
MLVSALLRRVNDAGGFGAVMAKGDPQGGAILVIAIDKGAPPRLLERGIGIPNDVRVVTLANRGFGPVFTKSFACIEVDPYQCGVDDGNRLLAWMRTGKPQPRASTAIYIPGDTFPPHSYATKGTTP